MSKSGLTISVIIPVYNTIEYLPVCLKSVVSQTIGSDNMEIILVDDGSTDGSVDYMKTFAERNKNTKLICLQNNTGSAGRVRNIGIKEAKGKWIYFVDSDDWLGPEALERLVKHAEEWESDVVQGKMIGVDGSESQGWTVYFSSKKPSIIDGSLEKNGVLTSALGPMRLIKTDLIKKNDILFPEDTWFSDAIFILNVLFSANRISMANDYEYYYVRRDTDRKGGLTESSTTSPLRRPESIVRGIQKMFGVLDRYSESPAQYLKIIKKLYSFLFGQAFTQIEAHAKKFPEQYPDAGADYKKEAWKCASRYYTPELKKILSIENIIRSDYAQKGVFHEGNLAILHFCNPKKVNTLKLYQYTTNKYKKVDRLPELELLSEDAWKRLHRIAVEAAKFSVTKVVYDKRYRVVIKGSYEFPLLITLEPEVFPVLQSGEQLIFADSVTCRSDAWGEPYQGRGVWEAAFSVQEPVHGGKRVFLFGFCFPHSNGNIAVVHSFRDDQFKERIIPILMSDRENDDEKDKFVLDIGSVLDKSSMDEQLKKAKKAVRKSEIEIKRIKKELIKAKSETRYAELSMEKTLEELRKIKVSKSWKLTKPFRTVSREIRKLLRWIKCN